MKKLILAMAVLLFAGIVAMLVLGTSKSKSNSTTQVTEIVEKEIVAATATKSMSPTGVRMSEPNSSIITLTVSPGVSFTPVSEQAFKKPDTNIVELTMDEVVRNEKRMKALQYHGAPIPNIIINNQQTVQ